MAEAKRQTTAIDFPRISDNNALQVFIEEVKKIMIPLVPEMYVFNNPTLKVGFQKVSVNIEKDAYLVDGGKYSLHLNKLNEIAQAAGLTITDSKELKRELDENKRALLIKHQVSWEMRSLDGTLKKGTATGEYNYLEDCARFVYKADQVKNGKTIAKKGDMITTQINKRRAFGGSLAESNAISRAISKALTKLQQSFTKEELEKPFLVPCVITDFTDLLKQHPDLEKAYIAQQLGIIQAPLQIANTEPVQPIEKQLATAKKEEPEKAETEKPEIEEASVIDESKQENPKDNFPPGTSEAEKNKIIAESWRDSKQADRTAEIERLIKAKAYKRANPQIAIDSFSVDKQIEWIESLRNMPDAL